MMQPATQHGLDKKLETTMAMTSDVPSTDLRQWLLLVANNRDKAAFAKIFKWFTPKIINYGIQHLNSQATANELLQETMSNVWRKAHYYNAAKGAATTWVYTIMRNACFDMLRKIRSRREELLSDDIWPLVEAGAVEDTGNDDHLIHRKIKEHLQTLPQPQQEVVKGIYFDELTHEALAKQLGIPIGTVKSRLRLALKKLKQHVGDNS